MRFERILFPVDFSEYSRQLNKQVEWLAKRFQSHVTLLHVFEIPSSWYGGGDAPLLTGEEIAEFKKTEQQQLDEYRIDVPEDRVTRILAEGGAAWQIEDWTREHPTDLIVMGTHGFGALRRLLLGSVVMKVLHDSDCPVWTQAASSASHNVFHEIRRIVVPLELTEEAIPLLRFAKDVSQTLGASVHLVHSIPTPDSPTYRYLDMDFQKRVTELAREEIISLQRAAGINFPFSITHGYIDQDAADVAADQEADLILIGRGKSRGLLGSFRTHAYGIIRHAPCPVLSYSADWLAKEFSFARDETAMAAASKGAFVSA